MALASEGMQKQCCRTSLAESQELTQETLQTLALIEAKCHVRGLAPQGLGHCTHPAHANDHMERKRCLLSLIWSCQFSSNPDIKPREPPETSETWQIPCGGGLRAQSQGPSQTKPYFQPMKLLQLRVQTARADDLPLCLHT